MKIEQKWQCCECQEVHDYEDDANLCCAPRVVEVYLCPICNEALDTETEAENCCDKNSPAAITFSAIELEKLGQQRLFN